MIKVSRTSELALETAAVQHFSDRLAARLISANPRVLADTALSQLTALIERSTQDAVQFDIDEEYDVERFVLCVLLFGEAFYRRDCHRWAETILRSTQIPPSAKLDLIFLAVGRSLQQVREESHANDHG